MRKTFVLFIASLACIGFGAAILFANNGDRAKDIAAELVEATEVLPENEGKLVIVSGTPQLANGGGVVDEEAGLRAENVVFYSRMPFQKVYAKESEEVVVDKGDDLQSKTDDKKKTRYYVAEEWILADQDRDAVVSGVSGRYENPAPLKYLSSYHTSGDLRLSGFKISAADVSRYITTEKGWFTQEELAEACGHYITRSELDLHATTGELGRGMLSSGDEVGDVHVTISYDTLARAEEVTLVGRQRGDELVLEDEDLVTESEQVQQGAVSKDEFVESLTSEDSSSRIFGIGFLAVGAVLLFLAVRL